MGSNYRGDYYSAVNTTISARPRPSQPATPTDTPPIKKARHAGTKEDWPTTPTSDDETASAAYQDGYDVGFKRLHLIVRGDYHDPAVQEDICRGARSSEGTYDQAPVEQRLRWMDGCIVGLSNRVA